MAFTTRFFRFGKRSRTVVAVLAAVLAAGCGSGAASRLDPPKGACACEKKICVCPHCRGPSPRCACRDVEKPE
jgi:hypothetical protein